MTTKIYNLEDCELSPRNGTYGGQSGDKEGIVFDDRFWIVKYPKSTRGMRRIGSLSYTTSPLSEYLGSHIYKILGYSVHDTMLGIRDGRLVVACQDFCRDDEQLVEFRQLKNTHNSELSKMLEQTFSSTSTDDHFADLKAVMLHLRYNPEVKNIPNITERFWDCAVIDGFINNNDRNDGNWGVLRDTSGNTRLAPVYDNGASFSPKVPNSNLAKKLESEGNMLNSIQSCITGYSIDGRTNLPYRQLLQLDIPDLQKAIVRVVPAISKKHSEIKKLFDGIPEQYEGIEIMSSVRHDEYLAEMEQRLEKYLIPSYKKALSSLTEQETNEGTTTKKSNRFYAEPDDELEP